jgi:cytochrome P450
MTTPAPAFNPGDPAFRENPFPFYQMGRKMMPVAFFEGAGIWSVFGYDDCVSILKDQATWSAEGRIRRQPDGLEQPPPNMLSSDPPNHTRLRGLVSQAFTPRMIELLEPRIYQIAEQLIDEIAARGEADIVDALAYPLPVIVIAEILGIPPEDREDFKRWSDDIVSSLGSGIGGQREAQTETVETMRAYFTKLIEERRANPRSDLISGLVKAELDGSRLSFPEMLSMLILLLVAGNETTTNLIGNAIIEFMNHPDQLQRVYDNPALLPAAVEEVLRFSSPVQMTARVATRDVEVRGKTIEKGQFTLVWLGSANRDESQFANPDVFDVGRTPNRHIAFGHGIHFCLGAPLARMEARIALEVFLRRITDFRRIDDAPLDRVPTFIMRGVRSLPIAYEAAGG